MKPLKSQVMKVVVSQKTEASTKGQQEAAEQYIHPREFTGSNETSNVEDTNNTTKENTAENGDGETGGYSVWTTVKSRYKGKHEIKKKELPNSAFTNAETNYYAVLSEANDFGEE